ncbi:MAG: hypothetical protein ACYSUF_12140, partial [Planctomycetota bacterium]
MTSTYTPGASVSPASVRRLSSAASWAIASPTSRQATNRTWWGTTSASRSRNPACGESAGVPSRIQSCASFGLHWAARLTADIAIMARAASSRWPAMITLPPLC